MTIKNYLIALFLVGIFFHFGGAQSKDYILSKASAFCHGSKDCKIAKNSKKTASGLLVGRGVVAASKRYKLGSKIEILEPKEYAGIYIVADRGGERVENGMIDIWMPTQAECIQFGVKTIKLKIIHAN